MHYLMHLADICMLYLAVWLCDCRAALDSVVRMGRSLKDKAPQRDHEALHDALVQLKTKWTALCSRAVDRFVSLCGLSVCLNVCLCVCWMVSQVN